MSMRPLIPIRVLNVPENGIRNTGVGVGDTGLFWWSAEVIVQ